MRNLSAKNSDIPAAKSVFKGGHGAQKSALGEHRAQSFEVEAKWADRRFSGSGQCGRGVSGVRGDPWRLPRNPSSDRTAWDALILSPAGALAPPCSDRSATIRARAICGCVMVVGVAFGAHDAIHNNTGLTVFQPAPLR